jgi:hypothetical protein
MVDRMTIERLRDILDAYGADPLRWPAGERIAAQAFAAREPRAAALVAEAAMLDGLLDAVPAQAPSAALTARVLAARPKVSRLRALWNDLFPGTPLWRPAAGLAAALVLGIGVQAAAADRLGLNETGDVATTSEDAETGFAPLSGGMAISEEDVL